MATTTRRLEGILKAYWKLDSTYGATVGADSIGSNTLSQGTVASATGKINEAASFTRASSQYLAIPSNSNLQSLKSFAFWIKFTTIANDMTIIHKGSTATAANSSVWIKYDTGNNRIQYQVGDGGGNSETVSTSGFTFATGTWYFVCCRYDTATQKLSIAVNGTVYGTAACTLTQYVETGTFYLGRSSSGSYLDGLLDEVAVSQSCFTIAEELVLYNGGTGTSIPFLEGPIGVSSSSNRYPRRLPPSFAQADNGNLYVAYGDEAVQKWDGISATFQKAGVPAPSNKVVLSSGGEGRIIGTRYGYLRNIDADGRVSNLSPLSNPLNAWGTPHTITGATNAAPIVITSTSHGLATGETIFIQGVQGNTAANGIFTVTVLNANTFQLDGTAGNGEFLGVDTGNVSVTTLRDGAAAVNEVQTITASGTPSAGTWTITFNGVTTTAIAYNANAATVQAALEALTSIGSGNITVSGGALGTAAFTLTFVGTLAGANQPSVTVDGSGLSGVTVTVSVATIQEGSAGVNEVQVFTLYGTPTGGTYTMSFNGQTTTGIAYNSSAATMQTALEALSNIAPGDVTCTGGPFPGSAITVTFGGTYASTNVSQITLNAANLTGGSISITMSTPTPGAPALSTSNKAWWKMDEVSGTRYASVGPRDLTAQGSCGSNSGVISNAVEFGGGDYLYGAHHADLQPTTGGSFTVAAWVYPTSTATADIAIKSGSPNISWWLYVDGGSGKFGFQAIDASGNNANSVVGASVTANAWQLVVGVVDAANSLVKISVNGGAFATAAWSGSAGGYAPSSGAISIGNLGSGGAGGGSALVGRVDEVGLWQTALTAAQVTYLYNSGSGRTTPLSSGTNEVQRITVAGSPAQGTFTLTYSGQTTSALAYNSSASTVDAALEALSNIGAGDVSCTGGPLPGSAVDIEFTGSLAAQDVAAITADGNLLKCSYTTTTPGSPAQNEIQRLSVNDPATAGTWTVTFGANTTSSLAYNISASALQTALEGLASIGVGNIAVTGGTFDTGVAFFCTFQGALANTNVSSMSAASSMTGGSPTITIDVTVAGVSALNEQQQVFVAGTITGGTYSLTYSGQTTSGLSYLSTAAEVQTALRGLSNIGDSDVTCTLGPLPSAITVDFAGSLAATNLSEMTVTNNVTGGGWARGAQYITYSSIETPTDRRVTKRQILRNKFGDATTFYLDVEDTGLTATTLTSYNTDEMLTTAVPLQDSNGNDLNVIRHGEPPNDKRAIAAFLNRLFLAVNHRSTSGELTTTASSTTMTGEDAFFRTVYDARNVYPIGTSNTKSYTIDSLSVPNQTVTNTVAYNGTTAAGVPYAIETAEPDDLTLYFSELDDPEWFNALNGLTLSREEQDGELTGLAPLVTSMLIMCEHRLYKLTFRASPLLSSNPEFGGDGRIVPAAWRGCINNRCIVKHAGKAYLLDTKGCYAYDDSNVEELSDPINQVFSPGSPFSIYWAARDSFHAVSDIENDTVKWFVVLGDGMYPRHALCYHTERKRWWIEEYPFPVTSSCVGRFGGRQVVFLGSTARRLFVATENLDAISVQTNNQATLRGTVTSANAWSLTDTAATFPSSMSNVPVVIVSGKGAGQHNIIVSNTSTKLTLLNPWTVAPNTTSTYQIGGIKWRYKTSMMKLDQKGSEEMRGAQILFTPTTRPSTVLLRSYPDFSATADTFVADYSSDGTTTTNGSDQIVLDMTQSRGYVEISSDSYYTGRGGHQRYITLEMTGTTNGDTQKISQIDVVGAEA